MSHRFSSLLQSETILNILDESGYTQPTPIQQEVIPAILRGKDILGIARTGSGKTASYVLPMLERFQLLPPTKDRFIKALVLVPSRELAMQVEEVFQHFSRGLSRRIKTLAVYGGVSANPQMMQLQGTDILVATPGRLLDLLSSNSVKLSEVSVLVLDEADKMLNTGFREEMNRILSLLPLKRQNLLFSATLSNEVLHVRELLLTDPEIIRVDEDNVDISLIRQIGYYIDSERKGLLLRYLLKEEKMEQVLVFVSSIKRADNVVNKLFIHGIRAAALHSERSQGARTEALRKFKAGELRVLVATDLASRGLDIQFLPYVINYELPRSPKDYIHRIGRTGRADSPGTAISLVSPDEVQHFRVIQKKMGRVVDMVETFELDLRGY
jgi:ATP-dependent RNA helicase RhlE